MEINRSARRHGIDDADMRHAFENAMVLVDLDPDADPPRILAIGPNRAGNLLEVIALVLEGDRLLAIHAMTLRDKYFDLLTGGEQ